MNREDIIRMAEECGIPEFDNNESQADNIMRFAALVVAAERERIIAANAPEIEKINAHFKTLEDALAAEREACAKLCEMIADNAVMPTANECAKAIRRRGN